VEIVSDTPKSLAITLVDEANDYGYLDNTISHNFMCIQSDEDEGNIKYEWTIKDETTNVNIDTDNNRQDVLVSGKSLRIYRDVLNADSDYKITCDASNLKY